MKTLALIMLLRIVVGTPSFGSGEDEVDGYSA